MAEVMEVVIPATVGFGDQLADLALEYIDEATGRAGAKVAEKPSTWIHVGIAAIAGGLAFVRFTGGARVMAGMIAGRHLGKVVSDFAKETMGAPSPAGAPAARITPIRLEIKAPKEEVVEIKVPAPEKTEEVIAF